MVIEVVVAGFEPSAQSITNFVNFLSARTFKPGGISVIKRLLHLRKFPYSNEDCRVLKMLIEPNTIQQTKLQFGHFFADGKSSKDTDTSVILGTQKHLFCYL
jgi:hypothetical protein